MGEPATSAGESPGRVLEGEHVALLDPRAVEEGRLLARERSTPDVVAARLAVLREARAQALEELAVIQGRIIGLEEILAATDEQGPVGGPVGGPFVVEVGVQVGA